MAAFGRSADLGGNGAAIDHRERDIVRAGGDERVDERAVFARAGASALAQQ